MRSRPSPARLIRSALGALAAATLFIVAHAALIRAGTGVSWSGALAFAGVDGVLWFLAAPLAMALGRRLGGERHRLRWQIALGVLCAPAFGAVQGVVAAATGLRRATPALASAFYYLDLNVAVLVLAAIALEVVAARIALARHSRRFLALEARLLEVRHDLLTLQLQPHFLFNALNSVVELVREAPAEAARVLGNLRTLFLATTQRSSHAAVTLHEELDVVDAYIGVVRARHADTLTVVREIDDGTRGASIPPLSLQPLVENAIQFALQSERRTREVGLRIRREDDRLRVVVTNSRSERDRPSRGLGIGLRNTRERLAHLFGPDHALTLTLADDRAVVELDAPFIPMTADAAPRLPIVTDEFAVVSEATGAPSLPGLPRRIASLSPTVAIVGFWTLAWLFWMLQMHFYRMARGGTLWPNFMWGLPDLVSAISWMAITPLALFLGRHVPVRGPRWPAALAVHVAGALGATVVNIGLVAIVIGLSIVPVVNVLNQVVVNCAIYALIVVWCHTEQIARWFDERQTANRRLEAELARARWEATEMRLNPERTAAELERLAALVESGAAGAEDQVLDMADTLRRRLQGADAPEPTRSRIGGMAGPVAAAALLVTLTSTACTHARQQEPAATPAPAAQPSTNPAGERTPNPADVHFITGMIGHHAQALVMAGWAPSHGASPDIRVLAERIINEQRDEIALMQRWLRDRGLPVPDAKPGPMTMTMNGMEHEMLMPGMLTDAQMHELDSARGPEFDRLFLRYMIQHHQGAVSMVKELFATNGAAQEQSVFKLASDVEADQTSEITRMRKMLASLTLGADR
jgi:uncharacterized protein (DUF305 family)